MIGKKGAMKKGFLLLEALLACVLISLLLAAIMRYHAQWSRCHKKSLDRAKALAVLITCIEHRETQPNAQLDGYIITKKKIPIPAPESSDGLHYPSAECTEITVTWDAGAMSAVAGGYDAS
jgi:type II secretory pathway pseudopilin PulG